MRAQARPGIRIFFLITFITYDKKEVEVVLVPLNGSMVITEGQLGLIENELNKIYKPAVTSFSLEASAPLQIEDFDGSLLWSGSGLLSAYDEQMRDLINMAFEETDYSYEKYYIFLVNESNCGCIKGFMPQNRQVGFVVTSPHNNTDDLARTIAHELGHGVFNLNHTYADYPDLTPSSTDNLMDRGSGTKLHKYQWDLVQNPAFNITLFDDDEEGASIENNKLVSITFVDSEKISNVETPHWQASELDELKPVCYVRARPMKAKILINEANVELRPQYVKAIIGDQEFIQTLSVMPDGSLSNDVNLEMLSFQQVDYLDNFIIRWYTSIDGEEWLFNIATRHKVYVVLGQPINSFYDLFEPVLYYSCREAQGVVSEEPLISRVWSKFSEKNLKISDFKPVDDNSLLTYYRNPFPGASDKWGILNSIPAQGLQYLDGECGAFRDIFSSSVRYHGVETEWIGAYSRIDKEHFTVKEWMFDEEFVVQLGNPYNNYQYRQASEVEIIESELETVDENGEPIIVYNTQYFPDIRRAEHQYAWLDLMPISVSDVQGVDGQGGILNPYSDFGVHYMVKINNHYYDPSYGKRFDSLKGWEEDSVVGYYTWKKMNHPVTGELILDLYFRKNDINETTIIEASYGH